jgi:hypothetical protein
VKRDPKTRWRRPILRKNSLEWTRTHRQWMNWSFYYLPSNNLLVGC